MASSRQLDCAWAVTYGLQRLVTIQFHGSYLCIMSTSIDLNSIKFARCNPISHIMQFFAYKSGSKEFLCLWSYRISHAKLQQFVSTIKSTTANKYRFHTTAMLLKRKLHIFLIPTTLKFVVRTLYCTHNLFLNCNYFCNDSNTEVTILLNK
jgi:hypothetical protein